MPTTRSDLSPAHDGESDATMATDHVNSGNPDDEVEFAISMAARLRTAARAADELGVSCRELARRFADQVDADLASDADPLGLPIGLAFREVYQQGHAILASLYEHRTAGDPAVDRQAATGIELAVTPTACKYCPGLLVWARDEAGKPIPLDPRPFPALMIAANQRWLPDHSVPEDNRQPRMRRVRDQTQGYAYRRHDCPGR
jgi:hypothetical protein